MLGDFLAGLTLFGLAFVIALEHRRQHGPLTCMDCGRSGPMYPQGLSGPDGSAGVICPVCEQARREGR